MTTFKIGSTTAKGGFANERAICDKFNNWKVDNEAQMWLRIMGYNLKEIDSVEAIQIPTRMKKEDVARIGLRECFEELMKFKKADVQIRIVITIGKIIKVENLSLKKANSDADYNQVDKRWVDSYKEIWEFDDDVAFGLKLFTGERKPSSCPEVVKDKSLRDRRRMFLDELPEELRNKITKFFTDNKILVVSDILKGRGGLSVNWMLVTRYNKNNETTNWILRDINTAMNFFGSGDVKMSPRGSLYIGRITMQRKGGTPDPTKLQFKIKPCELFELER
ncbi:MAG: type II restriction endonuclease [Caldisericum sp.]|uniref:type II restriction endonuclease n=1 Tax=Caldisericum sp. TaxID=2499687 RepID=UPI003D0E6D77